MREGALDIPRGRENRKRLDERGRIFHNGRERARGEVGRRPGLCGHGEPHGVCRSRRRQRRGGFRDVEARAARGGGRRKEGADLPRRGQMGGVGYTVGDSGRGSRVLPVARAARDELDRVGNKGGHDTRGVLPVRVRARHADGDSGGARQRRKARHTREERRGSRDSRRNNQGVFRQDRHSHRGQDARRDFRDLRRV